MVSSSMLLRNVATIRQDKALYLLDFEIEPTLVDYPVRCFLCALCLDVMTPFFAQLLPTAVDAMD